MAKKKLPKNETISSSISDIEKRLQAIKNGDEIISTQETIQDKLNLIRETLLKFKNSGLSYSIIKQVIYEETEKHGKALNISEQTLRSYCQNVLGFPKKERKSSKITQHTEDKSSEKEDTHNQTLGEGKFTTMNPDEL